MIKLCYLLWERQALSPSERRVRLLEQAVPALLATGLCYLQINIDDDLAQVPSPAPKPPFSTPFVAQVNLWLEQEEARHAGEEVLRSLGFEVAGYRIDEQLYTEYGENAHAAPRSWPDVRARPACSW